MTPVFVDTSAWFAFVNGADPDHDAVRQAIESSDRLVTSDAVFGETVTLCLYRLGHATAVKVGETLRNPRVVDLVRGEPADETAAWRLFARRPDKRYSFTDCLSFVMMRRLGVSRAIALDDDFRREGFEVLP